MHVRYEMDTRNFIDQAHDIGLRLQGLLTDSPYDFLEEHRAVGTTTRLKKDWFDVLSLEDLRDIMNQFMDLLDKGSHVYFWTNTSEGCFELKDMLKSCGYTYNNLLFWIKRRLGMGYSYRNRCEPILFMSKGKRRQIRDQGQSNVFTYPRPKKMPSYAKPPEIYKDIMRSASRQDEIWIDPFAGTDPYSTLAEHRYKVRFKKKWYNWTANTISVDKKFSDYAYPFNQPLTEVLPWRQ